MPSDPPHAAYFAPRASHWNDLWGALIVDELRRNGVDVFCLSPGSRCTPLTLAAADEARVRAIVHFDERAAAYHALGLAKALGRPVALICTSGTAVANYLPAIVEASTGHVPLIVLTADRPPELLDAGANQAIDQARIFGGYVRWHTVLPCPDKAVPPEVMLTTIDQAVYRSQRPPAGPVHLNCMFREPLAPTPRARDFEGYLVTVAAWRASNVPYTTYKSGTLSCDANQLKELAADFRRVQRGLVVVGRLGSAAERQAVLKLARALNWPVFPDITSGLRLGMPSAPFVPYYDQLLLSPGFRDCCTPERTLHVGGPFTSKRLLQHLEACPDLRYVVVADHPFRHDPAHRAALRIEANIISFCRGLASRLGKPHDRRVEKRRLAALRRGSGKVHEAISAFLSATGALSEIAVARLVSEHLPRGSSLFLGNSMPIRDMDMYGSPGGKPAQVVANRGASGIDGNVATAAGYAVGARAPMTAIVGDLALLHDLNSLALLRNLSAPAVVVALNNNGGGVFSFLPIASVERHFERFFATPHHLRFQRAAELFGLDYCNPESQGAFAAAYREAIGKAGGTLIEVNTDRHENLRMHRELQQAIVSVL
jgi:2-succinyl-5-enolpyruvyl-6-hydroxy-3-cyclohexene-1-carboxylate synthase